MTLPLQLQTYHWDNDQLQLYVPDPQAVQAQYQSQKEVNSNTPFPYWAKIWPAAVAMGSFLLQHPEYITGKKVLELAAGLGLPSLIAARYATEVWCSDYIAEAVAVVQQSAHYNHIQNIYGTVLNWHHLPQSLTADVLLLSDINYDPDEFKALYAVLINFLKKGTTIILSTPQRLMAKPFVERLLQWCIHRQEITVQQDEAAIPISLFVLKINAPL